MGFTLRLMPACHVLGLRESTGEEMDRDVKRMTKNTRRERRRGK